MGASAILIGVGMPQLLKLELFGSLVWDTFGGPAYLVGSSLHGKQWRDVDVRMILSDEEFAATFPGSAAGGSRMDGKWAAMCMAFSALGKELTGLPIDFQIQSMTEANGKYGGQEHPRNAIGLVGRRIVTKSDARESHLPATE